MTSMDSHTWQSQHQHEWETIRAVDFSWIKKKLMDPDEGEGWEEAYIELVVEEYRKFLLLTKVNPSTAIVPSQAVDKVWHYHILDTQAYVVDCDAVFGKFLHHFPYWGMRGDDDFKDLQDSFAKTLEIYESTIGPVPHDLWKAAGRCPNCGSGSCFAPGTMVQMADGQQKPIELLQIGDATAGGAVTGVMQYNGQGETLYEFNGALVTGNHAVWEDNQWKRVLHARGAVRSNAQANILYCIRCADHRIYSGGSMFADEIEVESEAMNRAVHLISLKELNNSMRKAASLGVAEAAF